MAFGVKYRGEFTDFQDTDWKVDILEDGYTDPVNTMQMTGEPVTINWPSTSDDIHAQNIRGSQASIGIYSTSDFQYAELFTSDNFEFKVNIYYDSTLYWTGWVTANNWQEPYADTPYPVTISAVDGLGLLKDIDFTDLGYSVRTSLSEIIYDIISEIGFTEFTEYVNLYESTMDSAADDSPLDQSGAEPDLWEDSSCYDVLEDILKTFNAAIIQNQGELIIYRYKELDDTTMYGRTFTSASASSGTTNTPLQYIDRSAQSSNFKENGNGTLTIIPQVKTINITQDYGARDSILDTWEFNYEDFSGSWDVSNWTETSTPDPRPIGTNAQFRGESEGVFLHSVRTSAGSSGANLNQSLDVVTSSNDGFVVDFDWAIINSSGGSLTGRVELEISIVEGATTYYFDGTQWTSISTRLPTTGAIQSLTTGTTTGWTNYKARIDGSKAGPLTVKLFAVVETGGASSFYTAYRNVKIQYTNSDGVILDGANYTISNAVNGQVVDIEYLLGDGDTDIDNVIVMNNGALNVWDGSDPVATSGSWSTYYGTGGGRTSNAEADPIIELVGGEIGNQFSRPKHLLDISIYERNDAFLSLVGRLEDVLNQYSGSNRMFVVSNATYNVRERIWDLSLSELI